MTLKFSLRILICFISVSNAYGQQFINDWENRISGNNYLTGGAVCSDDLGNIYTIGAFQGTADMDPGNGTFNLTSSGSYDIFVQKTNANGNFLWAIKIGGQGRDYAQEIKIKNGLIYIIGSFEETVNFKPGSTAYEFTASSQGDAFVLLMSSNGAVSWAKQLGGSNTERAMDIAIDGNNNVNIVGHFETQFDLDPSNSENFVFSNGSYDIFLMQLNSLGNLEWSVTLGGTGPDYANSIALDDMDNLIIGGGFYSTIDFDPGLATENYTAAVGMDGFLLKLDPNGDYSWVKQYKSSGGAACVCQITEVECNNNNTFLAGTYRYSVDVDPGQGSEILTTTGVPLDIFLQKTSANGEHIWVKNFKNNTDNISTNDLTIDNDQNILFLTKGKIIFNSTIETLTTNNEIGVWAFNSSGELYWDFEYGDYASDVGNSLDIDNDNNTIIGGSFTGVLRCDVLEPYSSLPYLQSDNSTGTSPSDVFVMKINPCTPTNDVYNIEACNSYTWPINNETYTISGTHEVLLINNAGCDSLITLNLTINNTVFNNQIETACESFSWIDGVTYDMSTSTPTYTFIEGASNGCDSIVTLNLTILPNSLESESISSCDSYTWSRTNETLSSTGDYYDTIQGVALNGCDSIYHLDLTINNSYEITQDIYLCIGTDITIGSNTYSQPGTYTDLLTSQYGCDSLLHTNIFIDSLDLNVTKIEHIRCGNNDGRVFFNVVNNYGFNSSDFNTFNESSYSLTEGNHTFTVDSPNGCSVDTTITIINRNSTYVKVTNIALHDQQDVYGTPEEGLYNLPSTISKHSDNPRNTINKGIPIRFKIFVENNRENGLSINSGEGVLSITKGTESLGNVVDIEDGDIIINNNSVGVNNIPWGGSGWSSDEFEFFVDPSLLPGAINDIHFDLTLSENGDEWETTCISFPLDVIYLSDQLIDDDNLADSQGNSNETVENQEVVEFTPKVGNGYIADLGDFLTVFNPYGTFENINQYPGINIWDDVVGTNGPVEDGSWWNYYQNQPNPINPSDYNTVPQYDFVFDYNYTGTYEFTLHTIIGGGVTLFNSAINSSSTQSLLKWGLPYTFNEGYPETPNCDDFSTSITVNNESTEDADDGSASVNPSGGTLPYSYNWDNGETNVYNGDLAPGNYSVIVTDNEVCTDTIDFIIQPAECNNLSASITINNASNNVSADGSASATVTGGTPPINMFWSTGGTGSSITDIPAGDYTLTVVDGIGCSIIEDFTVLDNSVGIQEIVINDAEIALYPNPTSSNINIDLSKAENVNRIELYTITGEKVTVLENFNYSEPVILALPNVSSIYFVHLITSDNYRMVERVIKK